MKFEKRKLIIEIEKRAIDKRTGHISFQFQIGPFKKTMGTTIGSALRRTLLSLPKTVTITSGCGKFHDGNCIREDLFELSLNLQKINLKSSFFPYIGTARIKKFGPAIITGKDIQLEDGLEIVNPYQYICSVNEGYEFDILLMVAYPFLNQSLTNGDPSFTFMKSFKDGLKDREKTLFNIVKKKSQSFRKNLEKSTVKSTLLKSMKSNFYFSRDEENDNAETLSEINNPLVIGLSQKLPFDIIMVDPISSAIQSCGFEITQTIKSSVAEYDELIKKGIAETEEFLRFVLISRGTIEPILAIEESIKELKNTLSMIYPIEHLFLSKKNINLAIKNSYQNLENFKIRQKITARYIDQILFKLDISHLNLPIKLELALRRQGFVNIDNLISIPIEFLKKIGLEKNEIKVIQKSLSKLQISNNLNEELIWDLVPTTISKL
uniref:RNA polymerase subunit alpha n=1 Tax=Pseudellipsoidion edaphicum TaxID=1431838 RepID=A0A3R5U548_9STRA|nr:RNA polymerase subunit alpha [Pseudellipsoidion edaphicum]QAA11942.1 RNA polymerase subunit alpha [Pseudellipsoidion edaphicum]